VIFGAYIKTKKSFHIFYCFSHFSAGSFYNRWKVILQSPRSFFVNHVTFNKKIFQFIHRCHELGNVTRSLQLIFTDLNF